MKQKGLTRLGRLLVPLSCGMFLTVGLLLTFALRGPVEAKLDDPGAAFARASLHLRARPSPARSGHSPLPIGQVSGVAPSTSPSSVSQAPEGVLTSGHLGGGSARGAIPTGPPWTAGFVADGVSQRGFVVDLAYGAVWGYVSPGDLVTVTRPDGAYGVDQADEAGFFWTPVWKPNGVPADLAGGGELGIHVNGVSTETIDPLTVTGRIDVLQDRVVGAIDGAGAGQTVTVTLGAWGFQGSFPGSPQAIATTDDSGVFTATFPADDLGPYHYARVALGSGSRAQHSYLYPQQVFHTDTFEWIIGYAEPSRQVTTTVVRDDVRLTTTTGTADSVHGGYFTIMKINLGDVVEVDLGGGRVISTTAYTLTAQIDVAADQVTGYCPPSETVRLWVKDWQLGTHAETYATADASGYYVATFQDHDLRTTQRVYASFADAEGDEVLLSVSPPNIVARPDQGGASGAANAPRAPYTATLLHDGTTHIVTGTTDWGNGLGWMSFAAPVEAGDLITVRTPTWTGAMTVADIEATFDVVNDSVMAQADIPGSIRVEASQWTGWSYPAHSRGILTVSASSPMTASFPRFDLRDGCFTSLFHYNEEGYATGIEAQMRQLWVHMPWGLSVQGAWEGDVFTATLCESDGVTLKRQTFSDTPEPWGGYWLDLEGDIAFGDWLTVTNGLGWVRGFQVPTLTIGADATTDVAWGRAPAARLFVEHDPGGSWDGRFAPGGSFTVDWSHFGRDLQKGDYVGVLYQLPDGNIVARDVQWFTVDVNYAHDWVEGHLEAGHTLWITVTESDGVTVKATAELQSQPISWWGGNTGFATNLGYPWMPSQPDIEAGDWISVTLDDGRSASVHIGTINGQLDLDADTVSGTFQIPWFSGTLRGRCEVWGDEVSLGQDIDVDPDGGSYFCDFGGMGWDLQPEQDVAVSYREPDGDGVYNVFRVLGSRLGIQTEAEGDAAEGGNYVFRIQYRNDGEGLAEDVVITDTIQGMAYLYDTSAFAVTTATVPDGEQIVWNLGTVPGHTTGRFDLFVRVTGVQSDSLANTVEIATSSAFDLSDPGDRVSGWDGHVEPNDTQLNVGTWTWTGDPAPGADFVCVVNVCNNGGTASTEVVVTETLHPSATLQTWWGQYAGWTEAHSNDHVLVVTRPAVPGGWCGEVYVQAHLDAAAWSGMAITHTATITASNDLEDDDNTSTWEGSVGDPRSDLFIDKALEWGWLTPGGEIGYNIHYANNGNTPAENVVITDTLPENTRFSHSWHWVPDGEIPVTPTVVNEDYLVWDMGTLLAGSQHDLGVRLTIDSDASAGDTLTNTAQISPQPDEERLYDNVSAWVETVHGPGPNLRVSKYHRWNGQDRIFYGIWVRNVGSTSMEDIWVSDTYPVSTTSDGELWFGHGPWVTHTHDLANRQVTFWIEALDPGNTTHFGFWVDLDEAIRGQQGLVFTNTIHGPWPGDVFPADNGEIELAFTGPDVYVVKWLSGGQPEPGELVTFTVEFGNRSLDPWSGDGQFGSHITDTLPEAMSLVDVVAPWDPHWMPHHREGNVLTWEWDAMGSESRERFDVVAQVTDTVRGGDVIVNRVEAYGDSPDDIEPNYANNVFELPVTILGPRDVYLPLVVKN